jgi:phosphoserine phosphatase
MRTHPKGRLLTHALVFVAADRSAYAETLLSIGQAGKARGFVPPRVLSGWEAAEWAVSAIDPELEEAVAEAVGDRPVDWALLPAEGRRKRLLVADMDSTIIGCECLDELADFTGLKAEIAATTERAMRGEIAFEGALRERVGKLAGLGLDALQRCFDDRVRLNPGAATFVRTMAAHGARCVLVSGGFSFFTSRVAALAGFHADRGNVLIDDGVALTGAVWEPILGREAKRRALEEEAGAIGVSPVDALAIGDGANDLDMIGAAGLGIAYRAKPVVAQQAAARIEHSGLETALFFQGYARAEFVES